MPRSRRSGGTWKSSFGRIATDCGFTSSRTLPALIAKFAQAIKDLRDPWREPGHALAFSAVILQKRFWLYRTFTPMFSLDWDLSIDCQVQGQKIVVKDAKGWTLEVF